MAVASYEYRYAAEGDDVLEASWVSSSAPCPVTGFDGTPGEGSITYDWDAGLDNCSSNDITLEGLESNTMYAFQTRSKDVAGNYSQPTRIFYATTPYRLGILVDLDGFALVDEDGFALVGLI